MKIAVFLHGTTIMHQSAIGKSREERVQQVQQREASIHVEGGRLPVQALDN